MSLKLLIDMNLSPDWVAVFERHGWSAVHWSAVGNPGATDRVIMDWARRFAIPLLVFLFLLVPPASAQQPTPSDDQVNAIAKKLYCPVCENVPLDVCPTQACAQWRATIKEKLAAGWTERQILDYFVEQYGERVLAQPSARGLNVLVWVLPPLAALAGIAFYIFYLRGIVSRRQPVAASASQTNSAASDEYVARLERELQDRR